MWGVILTEFEKLHYLDDKRFTEIKVRSYLSAGKPARYIQNKLREKGIANAQIEDMLDDFGYTGWMVVEAEQDPALANPFEYAVKARKYIRETAGI